MAGAGCSAAWAPRVALTVTTATAANASPATTNSARYAGRECSSCTPAASRNPVVRPMLLTVRSEAIVRVRCSSPSICPTSTCSSGSAARLTEVNRQVTTR